MLNKQLGLLRSSSVMTAHTVAGPPDATIATRAKSGLGIGDADSKAARLVGGDDAAHIAKLPELLRRT
jgi:hypothetical protein